MWNVLVRIGFAVYTQVEESVIKTLRFGHVSRDFESEYFSASKLLSLR